MGVFPQSDHFYFFCFITSFYILKCAGVFSTSLLNRPYDIILVAAECSAGEHALPLDFSFYSFLHGVHICQTRYEVFNRLLSVPQPKWGLSRTRRCWDVCCCISGTQNTPQHIIDTQQTFVVGVNGWNESPGADGSVLCSDPPVRASLSVFCCGLRAHSSMRCF